MTATPGASAEDRRPRARPYLRDPVLLGVALACTLIGFLFVLLPAAGGTRTVLFWLPQPALDLLMSLLCHRVARVPGIEHATRRFWRWLGWSGSLFAIGDLSQTVAAVLHPEDVGTTGGLLQAVTVGGGILGMVLVVLTHPSGATGGERWRLWLDAATVMVGAGAFVWYLNAGGGGADPTTVVVSSVALVAVFGLVKLALMQRPPFTRAATVVGVTGVVSFALATGIGGQVPLAQQSGVQLTLRLVPSVLIALAPRVQELQVRRDPGALVRRRRRPYSLLPYAAVTAAQVLLVRVAGQERLTAAAWGVIVGAVATTALVLIRQVAAFQDNTRLLRRLDDSMLELRLQERRFRSLVQNASDITLILTRDGLVGYSSPAIEPVLGVPADQAVGRPVEGLLGPFAFDRLTDFWADPGPVGQGGLHRVVQVRHADGTVRWLDVVSTDLLDDPSVQGVVCNARDVTEAQLLNQRLNHQATHDPLTQLANRSALEQEFDGLRSQPDRWPTVAVLMVDLDDFKPVNDGHGHEAGDALLVEVAARLRSCVRAGDLVARLGGDEFLVLLPGADADAAVEVADRIIAAIRRPVRVGGVRLEVGASVGVAVGPPERVELLVREADAALYRAKRTGKGSRRLAGTAA